MAHVRTLDQQLANSLSRSVTGSLRSAWRKYWTWKAKQATVYILHSLDDRTLKDIGMDRTEIESVVYGHVPSASSASDRRITLCFAGSCG